MTLCDWLAFMIKAGDDEKRDNAFDDDSLHALLDPSDPRYIVDAQLAKSHIEASKV